MAIRFSIIYSIYLAFILLCHVKLILDNGYVITIITIIIIITPFLQLILSLLLLSSVLRYYFRFWTIIIRLFFILFYLFFFNFLTILIGETVLLYSVQEFIEFLPTFFICLHNQLISINSILTYWRVQMFEKCDSSHRDKWILASFNISTRAFRQNLVVQLYPANNKKK